MEEETAPSQETETANILFAGQDRGYTSEEESYRKGTKTSVAKQAFHSAKEGFGRRQIDIRSVYPEQFHKVPYLQDAHFKRSEASATKKLLDSFLGSQGRLLAHTSRQNKEAIFRVYLQEPRLAVQSNAIWPQYSSSNLHQGDSPRSEGDGRQRYMVSTLLGRSPNCGAFKRGVFEAGRVGYNNPANIRVDFKRQEVQTGTSSGLRMAGSALRLGEAHCPSLFRKEREPSEKIKGDNYVQRVHKEGNHATTGTSQLDSPVRPHNKADAGSDPLHSEETQEMPLGCTYSPESRNETVPLQLGEQPTNAPIVGLPSPGLADTIRCSPRRLGVPDKQIPVQRRLRQLDELPNKCIGGSYSLVRPSGCQTERPSHSYQMRQRSGRFSDKEREVKGSLSASHSKFSLEKSSSHEVDIIHFPHKGRVQRHSGSIVKERSIVDRVVDSQRGLQRNSRVKPGVRSGSFCNSSELQTQEIHVTMPRRGGSGDRCTLNLMGPVEPPLPVPTNKANFKGFSEAESYAISQRNSRHPGFTNETLVHGPEGETGSVNKTRNTTSTSSKRKASKRTEKVSSSRLEVIKEAYGDMFSGAEDAIDLMASPLAKSSCRDYQQKWVYFQEFLRDKGVHQEEVTVVHALKFFTYLFYEKNLQTGTVAKYKSAISKPLRLKFNIELNVPAVTDLFRAMKRKRPCAPPTSPDWSLNKVLTFLDELEEPPSELMLLRKTAFLLLLATGWRISELHACVSHDFSCSFTRESILKLRPHENFLAKNECPSKRWPHKVIRPLFLEDGQRSKLCPVKSLQEYLKLFKSKGALFRSVSGRQLPLSIFQLTAHVCSVIHQADPNTKALVHDVRKYATSCALMETMQVGDLTRELNWSSPAVFYRYYLMATPPLERPVVLPLQEPRSNI